MGKGLMEFITTKEASGRTGYTIARLNQLAQNMKGAFKKNRKWQLPLDEIEKIGKKKEARRKVIFFRCRIDQYKMIEKAAHWADITLSEFCLSTVMEKARAK